MVRRLLAASAVTAALLTATAGSTVHAAPRHATDSPLRVVHVEMRCHTVGDHEPIT